jgi:ferritin-like metal-binding protein YciE
MINATLQDLFVEELRDLYSAENQILKALPRLAQKASHPELRNAFEQHEQQTRGHVQRLEQIFNNLGQSPRGKACMGLKGLLVVADEFLAEKNDPEVLDAGMISMAQRVEHYEIAGYGTLRTYAQVLGQNEWVDLLQQTLDEEGETDKRLTRLAESGINLDAQRNARAA